jgi:hypothetical protein
MSLPGYASWRIRAIESGCSGVAVGVLVGVLVGVTVGVVVGGAGVGGTVGMVWAWA